MGLGSLLRNRHILRDLLIWDLLLFGKLINVLVTIENSDDAFIKIRFLRLDLLLQILGPEWFLFSFLEAQSLYDFLITITQAFAYLVFVFNFFLSFDSTFLDSDIDNLIELRRHFNSTLLTLSLKVIHRIVQIAHNVIFKVLKVSQPGINSF